MIQIPTFTKFPFVTAVISLATTQAGAAGFALIEQSVSSMGTAYAGGAAQADDTSTLFFNPAGMTRLSGTRASAGLQIVVPQSEFEDDGTTFGIAPLPIPGGDGGDAGETGFIPHAYFTHQLNDNTWVGLAINVPFGLSTNYERDWVGRYHAIKSEVTTVNINPSIAFKLNDKISIGVGLSAQYIDAELSNAIDFGSLDLIPVPAGGTGGNLGLTGPGSSDGKVKLEGDDWGWGFNVGALIELSEATRVGVHYRSKVEQDLSGDANFSGASAAAAADFYALLPGSPVLFTDTDVKSSVDLPASFSISVFHQLTGEWSVMADYTWTEWNNLNELRFDFASDQPDGVTTLEWDNSHRYSVGAAYTPAGSAWTFRGGLALDKTPVPNSELRTPRIPGEDRYWVTVGAGYRASNNLSFDIGYAHIFVDDPKINKTAAPGSEDFLRGALVGSYDASVDILSAQVEYIFH